MTPEIEKIFQEIGNELLAICQCEPVVAALYVEAEGEVISTNVFFTRRDSATAFFKFGGTRLSSLAYELWEKWHESTGSPAWRAFVYSVQDNKLSVRAIYSEQFDESVPKLQRRLIAVRPVIGEQKVDYSNP